MNTQKTLKFLSMAAFFSSFFLTINSMAEEKISYIIKDKSKVFAEANSKSTLLDTLNRGEQVTITDTTNKLYPKIKTSTGKVGYIPFINISDKLDSSNMKLSKMIKVMIKPESADSETRARTASAVMGIRGFNPTTDTEKIGNYKPNMHLVYEMETREINEEKISDLADKVFEENEQLKN